MRGRHTHLNLTKLFEEPSVALPTADVATRGRNTLLLQARNLKLVHRYYYKTKLQHKQYDVLMHELGTEFDICVKTIYNVLFVECYELVSNVLKEKPTTKTLRKQYPYYCW
jgi:hypothetical protein